MTTLTLWIVVIIAFGFGLMFVVTFLQMMNINKLVRDTNDILDCLWVALGYLDQDAVKESQRKVVAKTSKKMSKACNVDKK